MKKIRFLLCMVSIMILLIVTACGTSTNTTAGNAQVKQDASSNPGKSYTFKYTHIAQPTHLIHTVAEKFKQELETRSNGRMKLDIFPAGQLGAEKDMLQQLESGAIDFGSLTDAYLSTRSEALNGWFMPFLFPDIESAIKGAKTESAQKMLKELDKQNLVGVGYIFSGNRHLLMKNGAVKSPDELKGKKIRIIGSPAIQDFWTAVGAGPTPMPLPEVYTAFQTGVIDGIDIDLDALMTQKFYEIAKELTLTNHMTFPSVAVMSKVTYNKLSPEDQKIVTESFNSAIELGYKETLSREKANLQELKKKGVNVVELTQKDSFSPVQKEIFEKYGTKNPIIKSFIEENKK
jgi:TRAP-type transport system periplasmic protein